MATELWEKYWDEDRNHEYWEKPSPQVLDFIRSLNPHTHPRVLDLGCGLGRHAIAFALAGFDVTVTDSSEAAIQHTQEWARNAELKIDAKVCDMAEQGFDENSFDVILSYNVIFHGYREDFVRAIAHVADLLRPGGLFYFTAHSRRDAKYGQGPCVAPHTYLSPNSITPGDMHYFVDEADIDEVLADFSILSRSLDEGHRDIKGQSQFYSNWTVIAERSDGRK